MSVMRQRTADLTQGTLWLCAGLWALGWAWWSQHVQGMAPCELCLWERWPYRALVVLGLLWVAFGVLRRSDSRLGGQLIGAMVNLALLSAIAISATHAGVEQGWWPSPLPECAAPHFIGGTLAERLAAMPLRPAKPCDAPNRLLEWLPISMTTLDLIYASLLLIVGRLVLPFWQSASFAAITRRRARRVLR